MTRQLGSRSGMYFPGVSSPAFEPDNCQSPGKLSPKCLPLCFLMFPNDSAFRLAENPINWLCFLTFPNDSASAAARFRIWWVRARGGSSPPFHSAATGEAEPAESGRFL